jgi:hypothetical protein
MRPAWENLDHRREDGLREVHSPDENCQRLLTNNVGHILTVAWSNVVDDRALVAVGPSAV